MLATCKRRKKKDLFMERFFLHDFSQIDVKGKILCAYRMATVSKLILLENAQESQVLQLQEMTIISANLQKAWISRKFGDKEKKKEN